LITDDLYEQESLNSDGQQYHQYEQSEQADDGHSWKFAPIKQLRQSLSLVFTDGKIADVLLFYSGIYVILADFGCLAEALWIISSQRLLNYLALGLQSFYYDRT
jgi:hypothetical protein